MADLNVAQSASATGGAGATAGAARVSAAERLAAVEQRIEDARAAVSAPLSILACFMRAN